MVTIAIYDGKTYKLSDFSKKASIQSFGLYVLSKPSTLRVLQLSVTRSSQKDYVTIHWYASILRRKFADIYVMYINLFMNMLLHRWLLEELASKK